MNPNSTLTPFLMLAQGYLVWILLAEVSRRFSGRRRLAAWSAVIVFEVVLAAAYVGSFTNRFAMPGRGGIRSILGVAAVIYLITSASVLLVYVVVRPLRRH